MSKRDVLDKETARRFAWRISEPEVPAAPVEEPAPAAPPPDPEARRERARYATQRCEELAREVQQVWSMPSQPHQADATSRLVRFVTRLGFDILRMEDHPLAAVRLWRLAVRHRARLRVRRTWTFALGFMPVSSRQSEVVDLLVEAAEAGDSQKGSLARSRHARMAAMVQSGVVRARALSVSCWAAAFAVIIAACVPSAGPGTSPALGPVEETPTFAASARHVGDACVSGFACSADGTAYLRCDGEKLVEHGLCRGPRHCQSGDRGVRCDQTIAEMGDACDGEDAACSLDGINLLVCRDRRRMLKSACTTGCEVQRRMGLVTCHGTDVTP